MSSINLSDIRLGHSELTDSVYAGVLNKSSKTWRKKVDVTQDFISCVISRWENQKETIESGKDKWEISVKKIK